jgi:hypothetical protein
MLQGIYTANTSGGYYNWYITTEDNRIDTSVTTAHIQFLFKFTNDMDKRVVYGYPVPGKLNIYNRYTSVSLLHNKTENYLTGAINFVPNGYWYYEVYEVSWIGTITLTESTAPATETTVLPVDNANGVVQGLVEQGKLYISELSGSEQVQYNQHPEPSATNYIWYGQ